MTIAGNLKKIKDDLPDKVTLIAVSKTHPAEKVMEAYAAGQLDFGENKVQEMVAKAQTCPTDIRWHLIGHLQTNKVKYMAGFVHLIHSVDSLKLLAEIDKQAQKAGRIINCLLQVHIAAEETKFGFDEQELIALFSNNELKRYPNVSVKGLMGMATNTEDESQIRNEFRGLKQLMDKLNTGYNANLSILSMGMSGDYKIAIEEGSTIIRVGSAIFGYREYPV
jgi:hypothetical protein